MRVALDIQKKLIDGVGLKKAMPISSVRDTLVSTGAVSIITRKHSGNLAEIRWRVSEHVGFRRIHRLPFKDTLLGTDLRLMKRKKISWSLSSVRVKQHNRFRDRNLGATCLKRLRSIAGWQFTYIRQFHLNSFTPLADLHLR